MFCSAGSLQNKKDSESGGVDQWNLELFNYDALCGSTNLEPTRNLK